MSIGVDVDYNAVLLDQEDIKKLNVLLVPSDALERDVRAVAGLLDFSTDEVRYISNKPYPFVYMYHVWLKRDSRNATLRKLQSIFTDIRRHDAAEIIEIALKAIHDKDPKEVMEVEEQYFTTLQRSISCTTLYSAGSEVCDLQYARSRNGESRSGAPVPQVLRQSELRLKNNCDTAPDVFVVYYPENEKHIRNVATFVKKLRKQGIDATCEMFESQADNDRGFYMYSKLVESEYVFVVCSETLYEYSKLKTSDNMDEKAKDISFIMNMILKEIYTAGGINAKFIPVLFPHGDEDIVPCILKCATIYKMGHDLDNLKRRVFKEEKYKLAPSQRDRR